MRTKSRVCCVASRRGVRVLKIAACPYAGLGIKRSIPRMYLQLFNVVAIALCFVAVTVLGQHQCTDSGLTNITVSTEGNDTSSCLNGTTSCLTLQYALINIQNCTRIVVTYSHNLTSDNGIYLSDRSNVTIIGRSEEKSESSIVMKCRGKLGGIAFTFSDNIAIVNITWEYCSISHQNSVYSKSDPVMHFPNVTSGMFFQKCLNVTITGCTFMWSRGSGIAMYDTGGTVLFQGNLFEGNRPTLRCVNPVESVQINCTENGGGLYIEQTNCTGFHTCDNYPISSVYNENVNYTIDNCTFSFNSNIQPLWLDNIYFRLHRSLHWPGGMGGGLAILLIGNSTNNNVTVSHCIFDYNQASWAGGLGVEIYGLSSGNNINVINSNFSGNQAVHSGGGLHTWIFKAVTNNDYSPGHNWIILDNCTFDQNNATWGGGVAHRSSRDQDSIEATFNHIWFKNCTWYENQANNSGSALGLSEWFDQTGAFPITVHCHNCNFLGNAINTNSNKTVGLGTVYTEGIPMQFYGITQFMNSWLTALTVSSTTVYLHDNVTFSGNLGINGGALVLMGAAWITITPGLNLTFYQNRAAMYGGAVYSMSSPAKSLNETTSCIFEYVDPTLSPAEWNNVNIYFTQNVAGIQNYNQSIYMSSPIGCFWNETTGVFSDDKVFHFSPDNTYQTGTPPAKIEFGEPAKNNKGQYSIDVMLGEPFVIKPLVTDFFGNPTQTTAFVELITGILGLFMRIGYNQYTLVGPTAIFMNNTNVNTTFYVSGPENSIQKDHQLLMFVTNNLQPIIAELHVNITPCKLGYVYNDETKICECYNSEHMTCINGPTSRTACVRYGYWYGRVQNGAHMVDTIAACPTDFCAYTNGQCPSGNCGDIYGFCRLTTDPNDQCSSGRGGTLCSNCKPGYSFSFDGILCVPSDTCTPGYTALIIIGIFAFWIFLVVAILIVLRMNLRIGSGYIYSFVYYFSIVSYVTDCWHSTALEAIVNTYRAFTQINARAFGDLNVCFAKSWDNNLVFAVFHYANPLFVAIVIGAIVGLARYCPSRIPLAQNSPIHAICILILLSFTSLSETSFSILNSIEFKGVSGLFVSIEPDVNFFDLKLHLPYAIVALLIEVLVAIPFTVLLLLAPLLARSPHINFTRVKPILDEFQACYRDECRWFAGYYFLCRQLVYILTWMSLASTKSYVMQYLHVGILVVHASFQPYKEKWLNAIDTVFLLDLVFLSLLNTGNNYFIFHDATSAALQYAAVHILILIPCLYFIAVVGMLTLRRFRAWIMSRKHNVPSTFLDYQTPSSLSPEDTKNMTNSEKKRRADSFFQDCGEREPLLAICDQATYDPSRSPSTSQKPKKWFTTFTFGRRQPLKDRKVNTT